MMPKTHREQPITRQMIQYRLSWCVLWIYSFSCFLARLVKSISVGFTCEQLVQELTTV